MTRPTDSIAEPEVSSSTETAGDVSLNGRRGARAIAAVLSRYWYFLLLGAVLAILYGPVLKALVSNWLEDPDYSHGFAVPVFAGFVLWRSRRYWTSLASKPSTLGLPLMLFGVALLIVGSLGAELFLSRVSLLVILTGIVLYLFGWKTLVGVAFPLAYLVLMIPLPTIVYNQVTFPLQLVASRLAASGLDLVQVPTLREGNVLVLPNDTLEVVEACSGIRSLMSLFALAIAYGYLAERRNWVRGALAALMLPIAVLSNGFRVFGAGVVTYLLGPKYAEGFLHTFSGWLIFMTALVGMLAAHWFINRGAVLAEKRSHA
jgi:exosortase